MASDEVSFEDKGDIPVPDKGDITTEKVKASVKKKIQKEVIEQEVRKEEGAEKAPVSAMTKDVPQLLFRIGAKVIQCPKFELDDGEASTMATHLNILFPISGKLASVIVIVMITLNKVYICMDAIQARFRRSSVEPQAPPKPNLPEPIS